MLPSRIVERLSNEAERLKWHTNKVLELRSQGGSQPQIARILQIGLARWVMPIFTPLRLRYLLTSSLLFATIDVATLAALEIELKT